MNRKVVSTLILITILIIISVTGGIYIYYFQANDIEENQIELNELKVHAQNTEDLKIQLADLKHKVVELDSILNLRKYIIPLNVPQSNFFKFVNNVSSNFSESLTCKCRIQWGW